MLKQILLPKKIDKPADSLSSFDKFNKKAETFFKVFPVPIYSHTPEAGNFFGLTKFNVLSLSKKDTISKPSKSYHSRDNQYNPLEGAYVMAYVLTNPKFLGSTFQYSKYEIDARKYFNPWLKHVIALQATTSNTPENTPFYELSILGSDSQMRGYYKGAYRDNVLVDSQIEYRTPI